jgi:hypothetical protein
MSVLFEVIIIINKINRLNTISGSTSEKLALVVEAMKGKLN